MTKKNVYKKVSRPTGIACIIFFLIAVALASVANAHRLGIYAWIEGDTIFTLSQFPDGKKIAGGQITVYDQDESKVLSGITNEKGEFSFKIPMIDYLKIVLDTGQGHQAKWIFCTNEIKEAVCGGDPNTRVTKFDGAPATTDIKKKPKVQPPAPVVDVQTKPIEQAVERALDKKLKPITRMLTQMQDSGPTVTDIFGGIGYIIGLMGIGAWFYSRGKQ